MRVLSRLALDLYRACRDAPVERFQQLAMDRLKDDLPFDAGKWVSGHMEGNVPVVHTVKLINRPEAMHAEYERVRQHDYLAREVVTNVNRALLFNAVGDRPGLAPGFTSYLERWRTVHAAVCARVDPFTGLATGIALWRESRGDPFTEPQRRLFQDAMPHLIETYAINRLSHILRMVQPRNAATYASAVADADGRLQVAPQGFQQLLRREWPQWRGFRLPADIVHLARGEDTARFVGGRIFLRSARVGDKHLVQAREKRPADELTPRELQVVRLAAEGLSYAQVAERLSISPGTVRTHLSAVYAKLAVRKQAEVVPLLDEVR
jgi:DNA-binding CsgD family transcriptional regulator